MHGTQRHITFHLEPAYWQLSSSSECILLLNLVFTTFRSPRRRLHILITVQLTVHLKRGTTSAFQQPTSTSHKFLNFRVTKWAATMRILTILIRAWWSSFSRNMWLNRPLALRGHVTNASFKQWVGILLMPKIDRAHKNYLTPEIWGEMHLREIFYSTLIFQQSSIICIGRHVGDKERNKSFYLW